VIPARFDYEVAESAEHALSLLGQREDAKLLAGGHSLLPAMKLRITRPSLVVDVSRLADLAYVRDAGDHVAIGALTRHEEVRMAAVLREQCPLVSETTAEIGDPQVRHRGTIGGSLAHGDPASDLPAVMLALDAKLLIRGEGGDRTVSASEFFTGVFQTAVGPAEMLMEIQVPKLGSDGRSAYVKFRRRAQDWATVGIAVVREGCDRAHEHGRHAAAREGGGGGPRRRRVDRGRGGSGGRRDRSTLRPGGERRLPQAPGAGSHAPGARAGRGVEREGGRSAPFSNSGTSS
jgi:carbon-monoxide dehydrogenase medium subunit